MPALEQLPDAHGHFGPYGGMFVPETLMTALNELTAEYEKAQERSGFPDGARELLHDYAGRPTPLYFARAARRRSSAARRFT